MSERPRRHSQKPAWLNKDEFDTSGKSKQEEDVEHEGVHEGEEEEHDIPKTTKQGGGRRGKGRIGGGMKATSKPKAKARAKRRRSSSDQHEEDVSPENVNEQEDGETVVEHEEEETGPVSGRSRGKGRRGGRGVAKRRSSSEKMSPITPRKRGRGRGRGVVRGHAVEDEGLEEVASGSADSAADVQTTGISPSLRSEEIQSETIGAKPPEESLKDATDHNEKSHDALQGSGALSQVEPMMKQKEQESTPLWQIEEAISNMEKSEKIEPPIGNQIEQS